MFKSRIYITLLFITMLGTGMLSAQKDLAVFSITFADKTGTPFQLEQPEAFLSPEAIARRQQHRIALDSLDLPVNPAYVDSLVRMGAKVNYTSKWLNAASIVIPQSDTNRYNKLGFVSSLTYTGPYAMVGLRRDSKKFSDTLAAEKLLPNPYGYAYNQLRLLNGDSLHQMGYRGKGIIVAVLDGGFSDVDQLPFFDSLRQSGRLVAPKDFVDNDLSPYESSTHGTKVLSAMAANIPGLMVGTGPDATYICVKTEDVRSEYRIEEYNWVAGLEYADSLGADVVNSSLGYSTFNDSTMNYRYDNLNGQTSVASRAADIAYYKGMIVVSSAGNEGSSPWKYIGVPADAATALSVGAVFPNGQRANFSSFGPTADGRTKPDVAATGVAVVVASNTRFDVGKANGTSLSSPLVTGMVASLWQAFPQKTNAEIIQAIKSSGNQVARIDNELGYGIPDFMKAYRVLSGNGKQEGTIKP